MKTVHNLKCWPDPFYAINCGIKTFEFRKNDRNFRKGDILNLQLFYPDKQEFGEYNCLVDVTYIIYEGFGIPKDYCIMSIKMLKSME